MTAKPTPFSDFDASVVNFDVVREGFLDNIIKMIG